MSAGLICHGCGETLNVPPGYQRNKLQCPCGVICAVPGAARSAPKVAASKARGVEEAAADELLDLDLGAPSAPPAVVKEELRPPAPRPKRTSAPAAAITTGIPADAPRLDGFGGWTCEHCGERLPARPRGRKAACPVCATPVPRLEKAPPPPRVRPPRKPLQTEFSVHDDGKPYRVDGVETVPCGNCEKPLPHDVVVCLRCGFNQETGLKPVKTFDAIDRSWDAGLPLNFRWTCFFAFHAAALPAALWGGSHEGHFFYAMFIWLWSVAMSAFLLGTFVRLQVRRDRRGRVELVKTWRFAFYPVAPEKIDLATYEGLVNGQLVDRDFSDYVVLIALSFFGGVPGLFWYIFAMQRATFFVALTRDHGTPIVTLYRGWSHQQMKDVDATVRAAAVSAYPWYSDAPFATAEV